MGEPSSLELKVPARREFFPIFQTRGREFESVTPPAARLLGNRLPPRRFFKKAGRHWAPRPLPRRVWCDPDFLGSDFRKGQVAMARLVTAQDTPTCLPQPGPVDADCAWRTGRVRARLNPGAHAPPVRLSSPSEGRARAVVRGQ